MTTVIDFDHIFNDYIANNQKKWVHDRSSTLGASEVFDCLRKNWFAKRGKEFGYEPDEDYSESWGAMERGNIIENHFVVPALTGHLPGELKLDFGGDGQNTLVFQKNSATPDGLITGIPNGDVIIKGRDSEYRIHVTSGCIGLEIKSIDPRATLNEERVKHRGQAIVGTGLMRERTEYKPDHWIILYVDASWLDKITPFVVEYDDAVYQNAKLRANTVWEIDDPMQIVPEGKFDGACQYCKWRNACGAVIAETIKSGAPKTDDPMTIALVGGLVEAYREKKLAYDIAAMEFEEAKQAIKDALANAKLNRVASPDWKVSWSHVKGRQTLDQKALAATGIDLKPFMKEGAGFDKLTVTLKGDDE